MHLDDTQLILLSRASQRADHGLETDTKNEAHAKAVRTLLRRKLLQAVPRTGDLPLWRTGKDDAPQSLVLTPAGLEALEGTEKPAAAPAKAPRRAKPSTKQATKAQPASKNAKVVALLQRSKGATVAELMKATGWQPHTVRAALTGLRKKGMAVERTGQGTYRIG